MTTATNTNTATPPALPSGIEIFKAGKRIDDAGGEHLFSPAQIADMAAVYDPALHEAPLCVGHPQDNRPAYGFVKKISAADGTLLLDSTSDVEVQFAEMVKTRRFPNRSASFYPPDHPRNPRPGHWYLRHVAFLGATPPAVPGLKAIQFGEEEADCINFCDSGDAAQPPQEKTTMPQPQDVAAQLAAAQQQLEAANADKAAAEQRAQALEGRLTNFAEEQSKARHAAHVSFAEDQVKAGRLKPALRGDVVAVLDMLGSADQQTVDFSEGNTTRTVSPLAVVKALIVDAKPVISFGEHQPAGAALGVVATQGMSDAEIDAAATKYARDHAVSYAEALTAITSFTH